MLLISVLHVFIVIRKLTEKRRKVEGKLERRDVTHEFSSYGSQVYAPLTRIGVFLDRGSEQFSVKSKYLNTYQGTSIKFVLIYPLKIIKSRNGVKHKIC